MRRIFFGTVIALGILALHAQAADPDPDTPWREYHQQAMERFLAANPAAGSSYVKSISAFSAIIAKEEGVRAKKISPAEFGARWYRSPWHTAWYKSLSDVQLQQYREIQAAGQRLRLQQDPLYAAQRRESSRQYAATHPDTIRLNNQRNEMRRSIDYFLANPHLSAVAPDLDIAAIRERVAPKGADIADLEVILAELKATLKPFRVLDADDEAIRERMRAWLPTAPISDRHREILEYYWGVGRYSIPHRGIATAQEFGINNGTVVRIQQSALANLPPAITPPATIPFFQPPLIVAPTPALPPVPAIQFIR